MAIMAAEILIVDKSITAAASPSIAFARTDACGVVLGWFLGKHAARLKQRPFPVCGAYLIRFTPLRFRISAHNCFIALASCDGLKPGGIVPRMKSGWPRRSSSPL